MTAAEVHRPQQVHFVAVNYFSESAVAGLIASLVNQLDQRWRLTVVDNSCSDVEFSAISRHARIDERIRCVRATKNLGYFGGARLGIGTWPTCAWTVVCNVDVLFDQRFSSTLLGKDYDGVPAPSILWRARDQNPFLRTRPTPRQLRRWELQFQWVPIARAAILVGGLLALTPASPSPPAGTSIYAAHGSCLVLPHRYFDRGGSLHHPSFLYGEEIYVAEQCRSLGIRIAYQPELGVRHQAHASTGLLRSSKLIRAQRESISHIRAMLEGSDC